MLMCILFHIFEHFIIIIMMMMAFVYDQIHRVKASRDRKLIVPFFLHT